jgi:hypothetical protein
MTSRATKSPLDSRGSEPVEAADMKSNEMHAATTIVERIGNARRGYVAWLALQTAMITRTEPAIDSKADASWRAR